MLELPCNFIRSRCSRTHAIINNSENALIYDDEIKLFNIIHTKLAMNLKAMCV